jgi:hypothetical protein
MFRTALVVLGAVLLCGCASLGRGLTLAHDALQPALADADLAAPCDCAQPARFIPAIASSRPSASYALDRRLFTPPSGRRPDQRSIFITASDYAWRVKRGHMRRRGPR